VRAGRRLSWVLLMGRPYPALGFGWIIQMN
jgi:hypothetical protein